jgi:RNA polymerase sigma-70 factor (ECF subfamily)
MDFEIEDKEPSLFLLMKSGEEAAFDFIFRKYYKILTLQAIRIVRDQGSAQNLVQDCFVALWEKRNALQDIEDMYSYLYFMVRNRCIDYLRKTKRTNSVSISEKDNGLELPVDETSDANELDTHLWQAIAKLPERCRQAFEYSRIERLTYPQIAQKMGISQKAVEALISRSLKLLRVQLIDFISIMLLIFR